MNGPLKLITGLKQKIDSKRDSINPISKRDASNLYTVPSPLWNQDQDVLLNEP